MMRDGLLQRRKRRVGSEVDRTKARNRRDHRGEHRRDQVGVVLGSGSDGDGCVDRCIDHVAQVTDRLKARVGAAMLDEDARLFVTPKLTERMHRGADWAVGKGGDRFAREEAHQQERACSDDIPIEEQREKLVRGRRALRNGNVREPEQVRSRDRHVALPNEAHRCGDGDAAMPALGAKRRDLAGIDPTLERGLADAQCVGQLTWREMPHSPIRMPCLVDGLHLVADPGIDRSTESVTMDVMNVLTETPSITFGAEDRRFVYSVARRIVGSDEDADDVAQEALLLAHRHIASFRGDSRLRTWLYRIAVTTALGWLRRTKRAHLHVSVADVALPDPSKSPEAVVADAESDALVREAVEQLEPLYRDVLVARAYASEAEVAECLGISVANVKIRAHRARHQLRSALQDKMAA